MKKDIFVKFKPWNKYTISSIIGNKAKFSTIYEFNDFNEANYSAPPKENDPNFPKEILLQNEVVRLFNLDLNVPHKRGDLIKNYSRIGNYSQAHLDNLPSI